MAHGKRRCAGWPGASGGDQSLSSPYVCTHLAGFATLCKLLFKLARHLVQGNLALLQAAYELLGGMLHLRHDGCV